jgi:predicted Rossmann fold flavoprotein
VLQKVKISGGGRCNVTHHCFDPKELVKFYPRGSRELLAPFLQFSASDSVEWFAQRGVELKTEADGRMFPVSDSSQTIVDCLLGAALRLGVSIRTGTRVETLSLLPDQTWQLQLAHQSPIIADKVLVASGSTPSVWEMLQQLGHSILEPVPSLFTFNIKDIRIKDLLGISVPNAEVKVVGTKLVANGPLLITHWGMSGPAILRLSAWGARELSDKKYDFDVKINWLGAAFTSETLVTTLNGLKNSLAKKQVFSNPQFGISARLWQKLCTASDITETVRWAELDKKTTIALALQLTEGTYKVNGKSTFKEEFVTAGGVSLKEINFKTFESRLFKNLFFAGEVLNIDAITGGFNFQAAWTGGWIVAKAMSIE